MAGLQVRMKKVLIKFICFEFLKYLSIRIRLLAVVVYVKKKKGHI